MTQPPLAFKAHHLTPPSFMFRQPTSLVDPRKLKSIRAITETGGLLARLGVFPTNGTDINTNSEDTADIAVTPPSLVILHGKCTSPRQLCFSYNHFAPRSTLSEKVITPTNILIISVAMDVVALEASLCKAQPGSLGRLLTSFPWMTALP